MPENSKRTDRLAAIGRAEPAYTDPERTEQSPEKRLLFPGCLILARFQDYELAAKAVMRRLGMELLDMHGFACCASTVVPAFTDDWISLAAYNLALAQSRQLDILTLCGSCTRTLRLAEHELTTNPDRFAQANEKLARIGMHYEGGVRVNHIIEAMHDRLPEIAARAVSPPTGRFALSHPCNVFRPAGIMHLDDHVRPRRMREVVEAAGIMPIDYDQEFECCGSTLGMIDEKWSRACAGEKLRSAISAGADTMVVACGNCHVALQRQQAALQKSDPEISLQVMFLPQAVGLALGIPESDLGLEPASKTLKQPADRNA